MKNLILILLLIACMTPTVAQVSGTLSYQGYLTADNGEPIDNDTDYSFTFTFFDESDTPQEVRGPISAPVVKGLFTIIIGSAGVGDNNALLPLNIWNEKYSVGITVNDGTTDIVLDPVPLSSVPYAFKAEIANTALNISATNITGSIANTLLDTDLQDLADGSLSGSKVGTGINASNITTGTLDGTFIGAGISASNITSGTLDGSLLDAVDATKLSGIIADGRLSTNLQDLAGGTVDGTFVGTGISAGNVTIGTMSGARVGSGISGANISNGTITTAKISGTIEVADGGTGVTDLDGVVIGEGNGGSALVTRVGTANQYLRRNAGNTDYEFGALSVASANITNQAIMNADINNSAAIAGTKISPNFGSQNILTMGNGGIGTSAPNYTFEVAHLTTTDAGGPGDGHGLTIANDDDDEWTLYVQATGHLRFFYENGYVSRIDRLAGTWHAVSDRRLKKNIVDLDDIMDKINRIKIREYNFKTQEDGDIKKIGVIAQEVEPIFPSLVHLSPEDSLYNVNYSGFGMLSIKAIQEQNKVIDAQKLEIESLKSQINLMKANYSALNEKLGVFEAKINQLINQNNTENSPKEKNKLLVENQPKK